MQDIMTVNSATSRVGAAARVILALSGRTLSAAVAVKGSSQPSAGVIDNNSPDHRYRQCRRKLMGQRWGNIGNATSTLIQCNRS
jgi:hypothetical protein